MSAQIIRRVPTFAVQSSNRVGSIYSIQKSTPITGFVARRKSSAFQQERTKVLYDGDCPLCLKEINILRYLDRKKQRLQLIDITKPDFKPEENLNISYEQAMGVMHVIGPDKKLYTKVEAMRQMYSAIGLGWLWSFTKLPIVSGLADKAYMWFANNRLSLTGRKLECGTGTCGVDPKKRV
ncbi:uncharacterized protein [Ptychodera flava]|uniref:uncharacterized protein n=1 Tax=Ptychodera flava TaxID=63121 RepID=UPI00396A8382